MSKISNTEGGIVFVGALSTIFSILKLTSVISWSWWWVLSPIWISFIIWIVVAAIAFILIMTKGS